MDHFSRGGDGILQAENIPLPTIAQEVGTPFYIYSAATLRRHARVFAEPFAGTDTLIAFAVKALSNIAVLKLLASEGLGADIVSGGELHRALTAGVAPEKIVFSGVGKTASELNAALDAGIGQFNVESEAELMLLADLAGQKGVAAPVALRVNPDVDADTNSKISTGRADDKFGIPWGKARPLAMAAHHFDSIDFKGLAVHIGSQITKLEPFAAAAKTARGMVEALREDGLPVTTLDLGGGLGIPYTPGKAPPPPTDYAAVIKPMVRDLGVKLILEPGRMIAGNAGLFVTELIRTKKQETRSFAIVDGAMNDLIRPALYGAEHDIIPVTERHAEPSAYDVAGPVCESTDIFAKDVMLSAPEPGDLLAFRTAGAYGAVQASQYNTRPLVPEVLVDGDAFHLIRRRPSFDEILALETLPEGL